MNFKLVVFLLCFGLSNAPNHLEKDSLLINKSFSFSKNNNSYKIFTNTSRKLVGIYLLILVERFILILVGKGFV